jgi:hypothetical protein
MAARPVQISASGVAICKIRSVVVSTEIARAHMISELSRLAEEFEFSAKGLSELRKAEGLIDTESTDLINQLLYTSSQLRVLADAAKKGSEDQGKAE